ncbi:hypothetical protein [Pseudochrobactrum sp. HB0163]|uniref:hypothetical protein n=1 Tax=Pseudochrobactrum sp. HB0163 TaxID=3450708 RepID=UPI003F6E336D
MAGKILIGKNGNEHGIWVARPGQTVEEGGSYLMSSVADMLKIHAQGSVVSYGKNESLGYWRHDIEVNFPELPFIPLAFMGFKSSGSEPFRFPPDLRDVVTAHFLGGSVGLVNVMPPVGISHNKLVFKGWAYGYECRFNYTVFLTKLRDKF